MRKLERREVPKYPIRIVKSFLDCWKVIVGEIASYFLWSTAALVLCPFLWNIHYDRVLTSKLPKDVEVIGGKVVDLILLAVGKRGCELKTILSVSIRTMSK